MRIPGSKVKPLFIPLKRKFFEAFQRGEKTVEYRVYGPRWNERTCVPGRKVTLSLGYGRHRRLYGRVHNFYTADKPDQIHGFRECYRATRGQVAACIEIRLSVEIRLNPIRKRGKQ